LALGYFMGKSSYLVCTGGVMQLRLGRLQICRWEDVSEIVDIQTKQGIVTSRHCSLVKKNGGRMELINFGIHDFAGMIGLLRQQAESRGIVWKEERNVKRG
jgi:hypothetical protein